MSKKPNRLSFRIPLLIDATAEGLGAIGAMVILVMLLLAAKGLKWW